MLLRDSSQVPAEMQAMHQMSSQAYQGGIVVDGFAIFGSLTLFALMIALSFGRVLGVDQFMARCEYLSHLHIHKSILHDSAIMSAIQPNLTDENTGISPAKKCQDCRRL